MRIRDALSITARCAWTGALTGRDVVRMLAYGALAVQASHATDGNAITYKLHVGAMRGTWRRAHERARKSVNVHDRPRLYIPEPDALRFGDVARGAVLALACFASLAAFGAGLPLALALISGSN